MMDVTPKRALSQGSSGSAKKRRLVVESYEEKVERRHENRQSLYGRNNVTSCRSPARQRRAEQNSRQEVFFKRRNLTTSEKVVKTKSPRGMGMVADDLTVSASTTAPGQSPVPGLQNPTTATQMPPEFTVSKGSNRHSQWGTKDASLTSPSTTLIQANAVIRKISRKDKATQVPSAESDECRNMGRKEASQQTECGVTVLDQEIQQLSEYLKEALQRELMLKQKMAILQQLLATVLQAAEKSWKVQLDNDSLRCKLQSLETQLHTWTQNHTQDSVKESMIEMQEQKLKYEHMAKQSLQRAIEEKTAAERSFENVQRSLRTAKQESVHWRESYYRAISDCTEVTTQHAQTTDRLHVIESKLQRAETDGVVLRDLQSKLEAVENETQKLLNQIDSLKEENELKQEQLLISREELQDAEEQKQRMVSTIINLQDVLQKKVSEQEKAVQQNDEFRARTEQREVALQLEIRHLTDQLERQSCQLHVKQEECIELHSKLAALMNEHHTFKHLPEPQHEPGRFQKRRVQVRF
ncbi:TRAF3-interacting JNK-activating modulator isoform X2 [Narcine bancroftii]|uniref:TRAF3-interacting JNK-activating modulator isoform X2 n=1 Tax=Narcine bancroftii TaxID=1343680 RepID=UPI0038311C3B